MRPPSIKLPSKTGVDPCKSQLRHTPERKRARNPKAARTHFIFFRLFPSEPDSAGSSRLAEQLPQNDRLFAAGADGKDRSRNFGQGLDSFNVAASVIGELFEGRELGEIFAPAGHRLVDRNRPFRFAQGHRKVLGDLAVDVVGRADLELIKATQPIELVDS